MSLRLPGIEESEYVPAIWEAIKRIEVAQAAYHQACASIDGQYLRPLEHQSGPASLQAKRARALFAMHSGSSVPDGDAPAESPHKSVVGAPPIR